MRKYLHILLFFTPFILKPTVGISQFFLNSENSAFLSSHKLSTTYSPSTDALFSQNRKIQADLPLTKDPHPLHLNKNFRQNRAFNLLNGFNNLTVCGPLNGFVSIPDSSGEYLWWASEAGDDLIGSGDSLFIESTGDTTFFINSFPTSSAGNVGKEEIGNSEVLFSAIWAGIKFSVYEPIRIDSISVFADKPLTFDLQLRDPFNNILSSQEIFVPNGGGQVSKIPLGLTIIPGNNYTLLATSFKGGLMAIGLEDINYPYEISDLIKIDRANTGVTDVYYYFFDLDISKVDTSNASQRTPLQISILPDPIVELGRDTSICSNEVYPLTAFNDGASYLWSTGDTTSSINVEESGFYYVEANIGSCTTSDSVSITLEKIPPTPTISDTSFCSPGTYTLKLPPSEFEYNWWDSPSGGNVTSSSDSLVVFLDDTSTFFIEGVNPVSIGEVGVESPVNNLADGTWRGLIFDVLNPVRIDSVDVYASNGTVMEIRLLDNAGNLLAEVIHTFDQPDFEVSRIPLNFVIPKSGRYRLTCHRMTGGSAMIEIDNVAYPYRLGGDDDMVRIVGPSSGPTVFYWYFYNWKLSQFFEECTSDRVPFNTNITIPVSLGEEIYSCEPVTFTGENPSLNYLWSTGETTSFITVDSTELISVNVSDGGDCILNDTVLVEIASKPGLPADGILCGNVLSTNYGITSIFSWNTGEFTSEITVSDTGQYFVEIREPRGCVLFDTISVSGFAEFPEVDLGIDLGVCDSLRLDGGEEGVGYLWNTGATAQKIDVTATGIYWVEVTNEDMCATRDSISVLVSKAPDPDFSFEVEGLRVSFLVTSLFADYEWDFGDGSTISAFDPVHFYSGPGTYEVTLTGANSCGVSEITKTIIITGSTSIEEDRDRGLNVFPNPVVNQLVIEKGDVLKNVSVDKVIIYDLHGKEYNSTFTTLGKRILLDFSLFPEGIYVIDVIIKGERYSYKILK